MFARVLSVLALAPVVEGLQITTTRQPLACFHPSSALRVPVLVAAVYERAEGDEGEVDVDKVNALIDERAELREARDFDSADAVRDELIDMGVTVLDNDMVWYIGDIVCNGPHLPLRERLIRRISRQDLSAVCMCVNCI